MRLRSATSLTVFGLEQAAPESRRDRFDNARKTKPNALRRNPLRHSSTERRRPDFPETWTSFLRPGLTSRHARNAVRKDAIPLTLQRARRCIRDEGTLNPSRHPGCQSPFPIDSPRSHCIRYATLADPHRNPKAMRAHRGEPSAIRARREDLVYLPDRDLRRVQRKDAP